MLIVVDFAVTFVVVFVSTALAMDCIMFVHKIVVEEELAVTVIVFCDVVFAVTDCVLKKSGVKCQCIKLLWQQLGILPFSMCGLYVSFSFYITSFCGNFYNYL